MLRRVLVDESGTESGGVVTPIPVTESVDASGYESVSMLDPQTLRAAFSVCGSGSLLVAVALGLRLVSALPVQFLFCRVQAWERRETGL